MRFGVILGFLIGGAIASLFATREADGGAAPPRTALLKRLKQQTEKARAAAREASAERQAEILRDWEQSRRRDEGS